MNELSRKNQLPGLVSFITLLVCVTPFVLNQLGINFSSVALAPPQPGSLLIDDLFYRLSGAFTYTILEWSAFCAAIMTAIFGFTHFRVVKDATIPVICVALFSAGSMDAFQTLAANRLISAVADNTRLIPFTWAISRTFNALIIILGVSLFLINPRLSEKSGLRFVLIISLFFMILAFTIIEYCATSTQLPITLYPDALITRPWDVGPLLLYILVAVPVLRIFHQKNPSFFSHALLISMLPNIIVELHMAFASKALFDNDFNIAHFLKIIAYLIPAIGLLFEHIQIYTRLEMARDELSEEKTKTTAILENAISGIITINNSGQIQSFNHAAEQIFGYQQSEVIKQNASILMPIPHHGNHDLNLQNYLNTGIKKIIGKGREVNGLRKDGSIVPLELEIAALKLKNETIFTSFLRDISHRKQMQQELVYREQLFSTFVNAAPVMMWMLDANNQPLLFNKTWLKFNNRTLEQEKTSLWTGDTIHPNDRQRVIKEYTSALAEHRKFDQEYRLQRSDGEYRWMREIGVPYYSNDTYHGFIGICLDISKQKQSETELQHYTQDLERSNAELEQFAYIASHDLQEPLRMVSSYTQLLGRRYKDKLDDDANEFIDFAVDGANRMQVLIQDLLTFSRVGKRKQNIKEVNLDKILKNVIEGLKIPIEESHAQISQPEILPKLRADPTQLQQLFQNLISNAIKYRAENRHCRVKIDYHKKGSMWQFSISDNGIGIEPSYFERIFIIFQRLHGKEKYQGTGIGLAVCKRIVEGHGGEIWLESQPGEGSTFYFSLPCSPSH